PAAGRRASLPGAWTNDDDIDRTAVTTSRYATAFVRPWAPLEVGGLEPARLVDARARPLTTIGGSGDGSLGLRITHGSRRLIETQRGVYRRSQTPLVPTRKAQRDAVGRLADGPLTLRGSDRSSGVTVTVHHRITTSSI